MYLKVCKIPEYGTLLCAECKEGTYYTVCKGGP